MAAFMAVISVPQYGISDNAVWGWPRGKSTESSRTALGGHSTAICGMPRARNEYVLQVMGSMCGAS